MIIKTDVCIIGTGSVGLFAALEASELGLRCCIVETKSGGESSLFEKTLSEYIKVAILIFNPIILYGEYLQELEMEEDGICLITTSKARKLVSKYVVFAEEVYK